jgi:hypothetical protein
MLKKITIHIIPILIIFVAAFRNKIPEGYIVAGGDLVQWFNFPRQILNYSYIWANESLGYSLNSYAYILYYQFFSFLIDIFSADGSGRSIIYYVIFLLGSYISFYLLISLNEKHFREVSKTWRIALSIGYTFNIFTFYNFFGLWGFSPFFFLYVLIPLIFGLSFRYFSEPGYRTRDLALIGIVFFLTNIPYGNFSFVVSLNLVLFLFICSTIYAFNIHTNRIRKFFWYYLVIAASTCWSIIPQLYDLISNKIASGDTAISLPEWVLGQATKFPDPFFIINNHQVFLQFPFLLLSSITLLMTAIFALLFQSNSQSKKNIKKFTLLMFLLYLIVVFLLNKGMGYFPESWITLLFANLLMGALRSFHKTIIFIPFLLYFIVLIGFGSNEKYLKYLKLLAFITIIIPVVYFIRGGILTNYSYNYAPNETYKTSEIAPIVKIPVAYTNAASLLNRDTSTHRILSAPYFLDNEKIGWRRYLKLKYLGVSEPAWEMFDAPMLLMNDITLFNGWNYGKDWEQDSKLDSAWLIKLAGLMNVKYILFHTDIKKEFLEDAKKKFDYLEQTGSVELRMANSDLKIYEINDEFYFPRIYISKYPAEFIGYISTFPSLKSSNINDLSDAFFQKKDLSKLGLLPYKISPKVNEVRVEYKKISPVKYRAVVHNAKDSFIIVHSETFHHQWKIYLKNTNCDAWYKDLLANCSSINTSVTEPKNGIIKPDAIRAKVNKGSSLESLFLPEGRFYETWFAQEIGSDNNHILVNANSNSWVIDTEKVCSTDGNCIRNPDGSNNLELIIEYKPQKIYDFTLSGSLITLFLCFALVIFSRNKD